MKITLDTDARFGCCLIRSETGRSVLVQVDLEFLGVAGAFGWDVRSVQRRDDDDDDAIVLHDCACDHCSTDGSVDCADCGVTAAEFIASAQAWLDDHDGATVDDPGYFDQD